MDEVEKYVAGAYGSAHENLTELFDRLDGGDHEAYDEIADFALSVDHRHRLDILLTFGGPNVWLEAAYDAKWNLLDVEFHCSWGSHRTRRSVSTASPIWRYCDELAEWRR